MKTVTVRRMFTGRYGTFGRLSLGSKSWWVIERPQTGDHPCIPTGGYDLVRSTFYGGDGVGGKPDYPCYEVVGVPGRAQIKFHVANYASQLRGCFAPGLTVDLFTTQNVLGVTASADAFRYFMTAMDNDSGQLTVVEDL